MEEERKKAWYATVTGSEIKAIAVNQPGQASRTIPMIVVYYRRDDGVESHVMRYQDEAMSWTYTGALAYYRHAPSYAELDSWQRGDRLYKKAGEHFPYRVADDEPSRE